MTRYLISLLVSAFLFGSYQGHAAPSSVVSGAPMNSSTAHLVGVGWPSVFYEWWHQGQPDWALGGEIVYGDWSGEFSDVEVGAAFNVPLRWRLSSQGIADFAFRLAPGILIAGTEGPNDRFVFGARAEFGVPVSVNLHPQVNLITGAVVPFSFIAVEDGDPYVILPLLPQIGVEVAPRADIVPWMLVQLGPAFAFGDFGSEVEFAVRGSVGVTFF